MLAAFDRPTGGSQEAHACFGNAEAMGATSSFSHILVQEEEQQRQLAAIVDGYRVGGLDSGALLRMAKDANQQQDRTSVVQGKSVSVRVELGGRRIIKKKRPNTTTPLKP